MFNNYYSIIITISVIFLYAITWLLVKFKKIKPQSQKKLWNFLLLINFAISGILGIILAVIVDLNITSVWYKEMLWFHVEFGIVMGVISVFHFFWHFRYYFKSLFKKSGLKINKVNENLSYLKEEKPSHSFSIREYFKRYKTVVIISLAIIVISISAIFIGCSFTNQNASAAVTKTSSTSSTLVEEVVESETAVIINTDQETVSEDVDSTCPKDRSCSYPGKCSLYIDENNNGLCDLGE